MHSKIVNKQNVFRILLIYKIFIPCKIFKFNGKLPTRSLLSSFQVNASIFKLTNKVPNLQN